MARFRAWLKGKLIGSPPSISLKAETAAPNGYGNNYGNSYGA